MPSQHIEHTLRRHLKTFLFAVKFLTLPRTLNIIIMSAGHGHKTDDDDDDSDDSLRTCLLVAWWSQAAR